LRYPFVDVAKGLLDVSRSSFCKGVTPR